MYNKYFYEIEKNDFEFKINLKIESDIIVGFCIICDARKDIYLLDKIYVNSKYRRNGFAEIIMNKVEKELYKRNALEIYLVCLPDEEDESIPIEKLRQFYWRIV